MRKIWLSSKTAADRGVDRRESCQVAADRLFQHHPRRRCDHALPAQGVTDGAEQRGRAGQVKHPDVDGRFRQQRGDRAELLGRRQVDAGEPQPGKEAFDGLVVELVRRDESAQLGADLVAIAGLVEPGPGHGDDSGVGGQLAIPVAQVQRRQQLAYGQVTCAPENHEVAGVNRIGGRHRVLHVVA